MVTPAAQRYRHLRRRQLDDLLKPLASLTSMKVPAKGWIHEIRHALGMSGTQLAARLRIAQPSLVDLEQSELKKSITLRTLEKAAAALGCRVVYAIVPPESLEHILATRARDVAVRLVDRLSHSMALEQQEVSHREREQQIKEIVEELVRTLSKELWGEP
jgi:predicted DNA-binding mobile mystery protein A